MANVGDDVFDGLIDVVGGIEAHVELVVAEAAPSAHAFIRHDQLGIHRPQVPREVTTLKTMA